MPVTERKYDILGPVSRTVQPGTELIEQWRTQYFHRGRALCQSDKPVVHTVQEPAHSTQSSRDHGPDHSDNQGTQEWVMIVGENGDHPAGSAFGEVIQK